MDNISNFKREYVFCGSSPGKKQSYQVAAIELGHELVKRSIDLVYGGGSIGLVSQSVYDGGRHVIGWLSGSDLKVVANFGCPSIEKKSVYAAKRLRAFFHIQEEIVCRGCKLKDSCIYANKKVGRVNNVVMEDAMRLFTIYTLDSVPPQLVIPDQVNSSISKLVIEAVSLCKS